MSPIDYSEIILHEIETLTLKRPSVSESLIQSGLLDSITIVDLIVALEDKTGAQIPVSETAREDFETVERISEFLNKRLNA